MDTKTEPPSDSETGKQSDDSDALSSAGESLEYSDPAQAGGAATAASNSPADAVTSQAPPGGDRFKKLWQHFNIYLLIFILLIVVSLATVAVIILRDRSATKRAADNLVQQQLSPEALQELASTGVQVGDPKQVLNIQSNSVFAGTVLVKGELQVAGGLKIGSGGLNIPEVNIGGTAIINQLQTRTLAVAGNTAIQGQLSVQQNLSVNGNGSFNGALTAPQLTTARLQLSGDLVLTRHLVAGGAIPGRANGSAIGSGGTSSVSGSDTAGTITVNSGSGATAGCFVTVSFAHAFSSTPHITLTPVGAAAASLDYYITRNTGNFSVCSLNAPPSNTSFGFDYHAFD